MNEIGDVVSSLRQLWDFIRVVDIIRILIVRIFHGGCAWCVFESQFDCVFGDRDAEFERVMASEQVEESAGCTGVYLQHREETPCHGRIA